MYEYFLEKDYLNIEYICSNDLFENVLFINDGLNKNKEYLSNTFIRCTFSK